MNDKPGRKYRKYVRIFWLLYVGLLGLVIFFFFAIAKNSLPKTCFPGKPTVTKLKPLSLNSRNG